MNLSRRQMLTGAAAIATAARPILGANDRVNVAVVGLGGRGRDLINNYAKVADARITALCDVDQASLERAQAQVTRAGTAAPRGYSDMRKLFADKDVDAVSMPLPNHWHALATIWACQAGKHVYVEKPASHNVWEGWRMVEAARKYKRCVQIGSQSRSMAHKIRAIKLLEQGAIGRVYMAKGLCFKRRKSIGRAADGPVPAGVDWDLFLGPAPMRPFNELRFKYNWHWFWDTGNGDIGNQGVHEMDVARWGLGVGMPNWVVSTGGKYVYQDDQETPNTQLATFDYGDKQIVFEVRGLMTGGEGGLGLPGGNIVGNLFYGSDGWMALDYEGFQVYKGEKSEKVMDEKAAQGGEDTAEHMRNFIAAVRADDPGKLTADVQVGAESAALCHLANISYRRGGRRLNFDAKTRRITNDGEADRLLTRDYRAPFQVPQKV